MSSPPSFGLMKPCPRVRLKDFTTPMTNGLQRARLDLQLDACGERTHFSSETIDFKWFFFDGDELRLFELELCARLAYVDEVLVRFVVTKGGKCSERFGLSLLMRLQAGIFTVSNFAFESVSAITATSFRIDLQTPIIVGQR